MITATESNQNLTNLFFNKRFPVPKPKFSKEIGSTEEDTKVEAPAKAEDAQFADILKAQLSRQDDQTKKTDKKQLW